VCVQETDLPEEKETTTCHKSKTNLYHTNLHPFKKNSVDRI